MSWRKWVDEQAPAEGVPIDPRVEYVLRGKAEMYDSPKATRSTQRARQFKSSDVRASARPRSSLPSATTQHRAFQSLEDLEQPASETPPTVRIRAKSYRSPDGKAEQGIAEDYDCQKGGCEHRLI